MSYTSKKGFSSRIGFIAAAAGSAVGVGNIWRFPYLVGQHGGGSFILIYIFCSLTIGFPLLLCKLAYGRMRGAGTYGAYKNIQPTYWQWLGLASTLVSLFVLSFYTVVTGWLIGYLWKFISGSIMEEKEPIKVFVTFVGDGMQNMVMNSLALLIIMLIVKNQVTKGIEKASKILMPCLVFMLLFLMGYACIYLPNSLEGIIYYLTPTVNAYSIKGCYAALSQSFLSLSIGAGILITYGSYVSKKENLVSSSLIVVASDTIISLLAGFVIFPIIFSKGINPKEGASLVFTSLTEAFQGMGPVAGRSLGIAFFLLLVFAAITSAISLLEVLVKYRMERWGISRSQAVYGTIAMLFFLSIPSLLANGAHAGLSALWHSPQLTEKGGEKVYSFFDLMELCSIDLAMPIIGMLFAFFAIFKVKLSTLLDHLEIKNRYMRGYMHLCICVVSPLLISILIGCRLFELTGGTL